MNSEQYLRALKIKHSNEVLDCKKIVKYDEKDEILDTILDFFEEAVAINQEKKRGTEIIYIKIANGMVYIRNSNGMILRFDDSGYTYRIGLTIIFDDSCYKLNYLSKKIGSYSYENVKETLLENMDDLREIGYRVVFGRKSNNIYVYL